MSKYRGPGENSQKGMHFAGGHFSVLFRDAHLNHAISEARRHSSYAHGAAVACRAGHKLLSRRGARARQALHSDRNTGDGGNY
jgi:hypothetical protein